MKTLYILIFITLSLYAKDEGPILYSSCKYCHGLKAEKTYMNKIPAIRDIDEVALIEMLKMYKKGELNTYGYGSIMKMQMKNIPKDLIPTLAKHIKDLK
jgi:cytochrome c